MALLKIIKQQKCRCNLLIIFRNTSSAINLTRTCRRLVLLYLYLQYLTKEQRSCMKEHHHLTWDSSFYIKLSSPTTINGTLISLLPNLPLHYNDFVTPSRYHLQVSCLSQDTTLRGSKLEPWGVRLQLQRLFSICKTHQTPQEEPVA